MAAIYRDGTKLVVDVTTAKYRLDAGEFLLVETSNGLGFRLLLRPEMEQILHTTYTLVLNESGVAYTKAQLLALLDEFSIESINNSSYPNGIPAKLSATLTRPADTNNYTAGDAINSATAAVKQKETMTLTGAVAVKQKQTVTLSGTSSVKQKQTITLTGTEGTAIIGYDWISFEAEFDTDLATTALNFVTANATSFLEFGIVLTSVSADLILEAATAGTPFDEMTIANDTGDLDGASESTTANVFGGKINIGIWNVLTFDQSTDVDMASTAAAYVTANATAWDAIGVAVTSSGADIIFESKVAGTPFGTILAETISGDLAGEVVATTANTPLATGTVSGAGGLSLPISFITSATATAAAFKTANEDAYLEEGIILTNSGADLIFEAATAGIPFTVPVLTQLTGTIAGSVAHTTANVSISALTISDVSLTSGGSGVVERVVIKTTITQLAGKTARVYLFDQIPTAYADNAAFVLADSAKYVAEFDVLFGALVPGSSYIAGEKISQKQYQCYTGSKALYALLMSVDAVTTPTSAGVVDLDVYVTKKS